MRREGKDRDADEDADRDEYDPEDDPDEEPGTKEESLLLTLDPLRDRYRFLATVLGGILVSVILTQRSQFISE